MCVGYFLVLLDVTIVTVALPSIGADLGADVGDLQWVVTATRWRWPRCCSPAGGRSICAATGGWCCSPGRVRCRVGGLRAGAGRGRAGRRPGRAGRRGGAAAARNTRDHRPTFPRRLASPRDRALAGSAVSRCRRPLLGGLLVQTRLAGGVRDQRPGRDRLRASSSPGSVRESVAGRGGSTVRRARRAALAATMYAVIESGDGSRRRVLVAAASRVLSLVVSSWWSGGVRSDRSVAAVPPAAFSSRTRSPP